MAFETVTGAGGYSLPIEILPEVPKEATKKVVKGFSDEFKKAFAGVKGAPSQALSKLGKGAGGLVTKGAGAIGGTKAGAATGKGLGAIAGVAGIGAGVGAMAATGGMAAITGAFSGIEKIIEMIAGFIEKANPAVMEQLSIAFDDIGAVVGHTLMPVMQALIPLVRMWGDFLASILPDQAQMAELMMEMQPLFDALGDLFKELAPLIKDLVIEFMKFVIWVTRLLAQLGKEAINSFTFQVKGFKEMTGMGGRSGSGFDRSSFGASARGSSTSGIAELGKSLQLAAFGRGISPAEKAAIATAENTKAMKELLQRHQGDMGKIADEVAWRPNFSFF